MLRSASDSPIDHKKGKIAMRKALLLSVASMLVLSASAFAQTYPEKGRTITSVVPSTAGGGLDTAARLMAPLLEKDLGIPVEVVNRPGASMQIGATYVAQAKPDGYTIMWSVLPTLASIYLDPERKSPFKRESLTLVGLYYGAPFAIVVRGDSPYKELKDLIDVAKANPGKLKVGTSGFMATGHFAALSFENGAGIKVATVNFQGGGPQLTALLGNHIDATTQSIGELLAHKKGGTIRVLAVMSQQRDELMPDVPTTAEAGFPEIEPIGSDIGITVPAGTPQEVVQRLTEALKRGTEDPGLKARMTELGNTLEYLGPKEYVEFWDKVEVRFKPLVEAARKQGE
jgi:tripartite-type tricarboxylate transporter receptor subunit TctC